MALIEIRFQKGDFTPLGTVELADDVPIRMLFDYILEQLGLDRTVGWHLLPAEGEREIDLQYAQTLADIGLEDGSVLRLRPGIRRLGRYELGDEIGTGGMGTVYEAYDPSLDRRVAIKVIRKELAENEQAMQQLAQEARTLALLEDHPSIVKVYDFVYQGRGKDEVPYLVMQYVEGYRLDRLIEERHGLTPEQTGDILTALASALDIAHAGGILHRNIKPANVLLQPHPGRPDQWIPKLMDLGLAPATGERGAPAQSEAAAGSPSYRSPEGLRGESLTRQSDIYSLGVLVYQMLTGRLPFPDSASPLADRQSLPPAPGQFRDLPGPVDAVVLKALAPSPADRYPTAGEFAQAFGRALRGEPLAEPARATKKEKKKKPRAERKGGISKKGWAGVAVGGVLLLAALAAGAWYLFLRPPDVGALMEQAQQQLAAGQYDQARESFGQILEQQPAHAEALGGMGRSYEAQEQWQQAAEWYGRWVQAAPDDAEARLALGQTLSELGDPWAAAAEYQRAAELQPTAVQAWQGLGQTFYDLGEYERALYPLEQWDQLVPDQVQVKEMRGWSYFHLGRYDEAAAQFRQLTQLAPDAAVGYEGLGRSYYEAQDYEGALPVLQEWAGMEPSAESLEWVGWAALRSNQYSSAVGAFQQALTLGEGASLYNGLGQAYNGLEAYDQALESFERSLELEPGQADLYWRIGQVHRAREEWQPAVDAFLRALELGAEDARVYSSLGYTYRSLGLQEQALTAFQRWAELRPDNAQAWSAVGWTEFALREYTAAIEAFQTALGLEDRSSFYLGIAESYRLLGDCTQAIPFYEQALALEPENEQALAGLEACQP